MPLEKLEKLNKERLKLSDFDTAPPEHTSDDPPQAARGTADFCIKIDFEKGTGNPSRVFRSMSDLIDAFQTVDKSLVRSIDAKIEPVLLLEDVESGSVKAWLRQAIDSVDDDGLKKGDWKAIVGSYLLKAKYLIIRFLDEKTDIRGEQEIAALESDIQRLAEETDVNRFPSYEPISRRNLVFSIERINLALEPLNDSDKAEFIIGEQTANFNLSLYISPETIEELITSEMIQSLTEMILKVKKPDFLGESQWEFRYDNRTIPAKMLDTNWIAAFQNGEVLVRPGDAIRAKVLTEVRYGFDREVVATHYAVVEVMQVIPKDASYQPPLRFPPISN